MTGLSAQSAQYAHEGVIGWRPGHGAMRVVYPPASAAFCAPNGNRRRFGRRASSPRVPTNAGPPLYWLFSIGPSGCGHAPEMAASSGTDEARAEPWRAARRVDQRELSHTIVVGLEGEAAQQSSPPRDGARAMSMVSGTIKPIRAGDTHRGTPADHGSGLFQDFLVRKCASASVMFCGHTNSGLRSAAKNPTSSTPSRRRSVAQSG